RRFLGGLPCGDQLPKGDVELAAANRLAEVAVGTPPARFGLDLGIRTKRTDDDAELRVALAEDGDRAQAVVDRHLDLDDHDLDVVLADAGNGVLGAIGFHHDDRARQPSFYDVAHHLTSLPPVV